MFALEKQKPYIGKKYNNKSRNIRKDTPSFSSTLLDEIYRSIDGGAEKSEGSKCLRQKPGKKPTTITEEEEEDRASHRRACLAEKWIQNDKNGKAASKRIITTSDFLFSTSTWSSNSDSSAEFSTSQTGPKVSCFSTRPKPIRTALPACESKRADYSPFGGNVKIKIDEDGPIKPKSWALKLYSNLKKAKEPMSPIGRMTGFMSSIFISTNERRLKNTVPYSRDIRDSKPSRDARSACSLVAESRDETRGGAHRMVRFCPTMDVDSRPCEEKHGKRRLMVKTRKFETGMKKEGKGYNGNKRMDDISVISEIMDYKDDDNKDDQYDGISDSSSDLFELRDLALFANNRFCEELPVYETIRSGCLIRRMLED